MGCCNEKPVVTPKSSSVIPTALSLVASGKFGIPNLSFPSIDYAGLNSSVQPSCQEQVATIRLERKNMETMIKGVPSPTSSAHDCNQFVAHDNKSSLYLAESELKLGKFLGKGCFGSVSLATYNDNNIVVKKYAGGRPPDELMSQMRHEVKVMKSLRHVNLVQHLGIVDIADCEAVPWLMIEYCSGGDLFQLLYNSSDEFPWDQRIVLASDIITGLAYLHQQNILHCGLKSTNVLLTGERRGKLSDFGMSVFRDHSTATMSVGDSAAALFSSVRWMAPELFSRSGAKLSCASDMWAFGMVLFEITGRKLPFSNYSDTKVRDKLSKGESEKVPDICFKEAPEFAEVMECCWLPHGERLLAAAAAFLVNKVTTSNRDDIKK